MHNGKFRTERVSTLPKQSKYLHMSKKVLPAKRKAEDNKAEQVGGKSAH